MIYDAICWIVSSTVNLKTTILQDLQQLLFHVSKKNPVAPREKPSCSLGFISAFVKVSQNKARISAVISEIRICLCFQETKKEPAWTPLSYWLLIMQHLHKFSPTPVADIHVQSLPAYILLCIPWLLRTLKATNRITVTVSSVGRTPLTVFPQKTLCCPASKSNGDVILHSSNFIVSVASPLIKSITSGNTRLTKKKHHHSATKYWGSVSTYTDKICIASLSPQLFFSKYFHPFSHHFLSTLNSSPYNGSFFLWMLWSWPQLLFKK